MTATNSGATDYVNPLYLAGAAMSMADYPDELMERAAWINECRMRLFESLGAVLTRSGGSIRYWRNGRIDLAVNRRGHRRMIGFYAGFCDESRGLHWDRKRD